MISWMFGKQAGWIRIGKLVAHWKHSSNPALFSERYGYTKYTNIGFGYRINFSRNK